MFEIGTVNRGATPWVMADEVDLVIFMDSSFWILDSVCSFISPGTCGVNIKLDFSEHLIVQLIESDPC